MTANDARFDDPNPEDPEGGSAVDTLENACALLLGQPPANVLHDGFGAVLRRPDALLLFGRSAEQSKAPSHLPMTGAGYPVFLTLDRRATHRPAWRAVLRPVAALGRFARQAEGPLTGSAGGFGVNWQTQQGRPPANWSQARSGTAIKGSTARFLGRRTGRGSCRHVGRWRNIP